MGQPVNNACACSRLHRSFSPGHHQHLPCHWGRCATGLEQSVRAERAPGEVSLSSLTDVLGFAVALVPYNHGNNSES